MQPSKAWPLGFDFQLDLCPDVFTIVHGGVEVYDAWREKITHVVPFSSTAFRQLFLDPITGKWLPTYGLNRRLIDGFLDGEPIYREIPSCHSLSQEEVSFLVRLAKERK